MSKSQEEKINILIYELKKDDYIKFVGQLYQSLSTIMYNCHICCRLHESKL